MHAFLIFTLGPNEIKMKSALVVQKLIYWNLLDKSRLIVQTPQNLPFISGTQDLMYPGSLQSIIEIFFLQLCRSGESSGLLMTSAKLRFNDGPYKLKLKKYLKLVCSILMRRAHKLTSSRYNMT